MKIEISGGIVTNIEATEPISIHVIDHDLVKFAGEDIEYVASPIQPDYIVDDDEFDERLKETISEYL